MSTDLPIISDIAIVLFLFCRIKIIINCHWLCLASMLPRMLRRYPFNVIAVWIIFLLGKYFLRVKTVLCEWFLSYADAILCVLQVVEVSAVQDQTRSQYRFRSTADGYQIGLVLQTMQTQCNNSRHGTVKLLPVV